MTDFKVGDRVRATGRLVPVVLYDGIIVEITPLGNTEFCIIEIEEGSGIWSNHKQDTIDIGALQKLEPTIE